MSWRTRFTSLERAIESEKVDDADRHDRELLDIEVVRCVLAAVYQVDLGNGKHMGVGVQVPVKRQVALRRPSARAAARDTPRRALAPSRLRSGVPSSSTRRASSCALGRRRGTYEGRS